MRINELAYILIFDSGVPISYDISLDSPQSMALFNAHSKGVIKICVPEIVIREVANKYQEEEQKARRSYSQAVRKLRNYRRDLDLPIVDEPEPGTYEKNLREMLRDFEVDVVPMPQVAHSAVVARALARTRPFDSGGKDGYRDTLVWHSLVSAISGDGTPVVFLTTDQKAFGDPEDSKSLHPDLRSELSDLGIEGDSVVLVDSLEDALKLVVTPAEEIRDELTELLNEDQTFRSRTRDLLMGIANDSDLNAPQYQPLELGSDGPPLEVLALRNFRHPIVIDARVLEGDSAVVEILVFVEAIGQTVSSAEAFDWFLKSMTRYPAFEGRADADFLARAFAPVQLTTPAVLYYDAIYHTQEKRFRAIDLTDIVLIDDENKSESQGDQTNTEPEDPEAA